MSAAPAIDADRRARLAKVHIGKKQLRWPDDIYRDVLERMFNVTSAKDLSNRQLDELIQHMKDRGFKAQSNAARPRVVSRETSSKTAALAHEVVSKIRAQWLSLYNLGIVRDPKDSAIEAFMASQTKPGPGVDGIRKLAWLSPQEAYKVIEALKSWGLREAQLDYKVFKNPRHAVIVAQSKKLQRIGVWTHDQVAVTAHKMFNSSRWTQLASPELDALIKTLGLAIRNAPKPEASDG